MPIITKPASIQKNSPAEISLDKAALAAVPSVVADDYFSDSDNWKDVLIYYKSSTGNQREILKFNAELASPTANFLVSEKAKDIFTVQKIVIIDFDSGKISIPRSQLTVEDFDIDMTPAAAAGIPFQLFANFQSYNPLTDPTFLERSVNGFSAPTSLGLHNVSLGSVVNGVANYDVTFNLSNLTSNEGAGIYIGILGSSNQPNTVSLSDISSNYEDYAVTANLSVGTSMNVVTPFQGSYSSAIVPSGATKSIRFKQTGTTLEYYANGSLVYTQTVDSSKNVPYLYPYLRGNWAFTVDSVIIG